MVVSVCRLLYIIPQEKEKHERVKKEVQETVERLEKEMEEELQREKKEKERHLEQISDLQSRLDSLQVEKLQTEREELQQATKVYNIYVCTHI